MPTQKHNNKLKIMKNNISTYGKWGFDTGAEHERLQLVLKSKPAAIAFTDSVFALQQTNLGFRKLFAISPKQYEAATLHITKAINAHKFTLFVNSLIGLEDERRGVFTYPDLGVGHPAHPEARTVKIKVLPLVHGGFMFVFQDSLEINAIENHMSTACSIICREQKQWLKRQGISLESLMTSSIKGGTPLEDEREANVRMHYVISQLEAYATLGAYDAALQLEPISLEHAIGRAEHMLHAHFTDKSFNAVCSLPQNSCETILGNAKCLPELFFHIFHNTKKFSRNNAKMFIEGTTQKKHLRLTLSQTASDINPGDINRLFQPFYRGPEAKRNYPGIGLGLSLASRIAKLHGGKLEAEYAGNLRFILKLKRA